MVESDRFVVSRFGVQDEKEFYIQNGRFGYVNQLKPDTVIEKMDTKSGRKDLLMSVVKDMDIYEVLDWYSKKCPAISDIEIKHFWADDRDYLHDWMVTSELKDIEDKEIIRQNEETDNYRDVYLDENGSGEPEIYADEWEEEQMIVEDVLREYDGSCLDFENLPENEKDVFMIDSFSDVVKNLQKNVFQTYNAVKVPRRLSIVDIETGDRLDFKAKVIESGYEFFEPGLEVYEDGQKIYDRDAMSVASYHNEVYVLGDFENEDALCDYLSEKYLDAYFNRSFEEVDLYEHEGLKKHWENKSYAEEQEQLMKMTENRKENNWNVFENISNKNIKPAKGRFDK